MKPQIALFQPELDAALYVGVFVVVAVFLLGGILLVMQIIKLSKRTPPVTEEIDAKIRGCKKTCEEHRSRMDADLGELRDGLETRSEAGKVGRAAIHRDVRRVEERISKTEAFVETMNARQMQDGAVLRNISHEVGELKGLLAGK